MLIQIDGWFAGGKAVLQSLMDGHNEIFVNPVHDFTHAHLLDKTNEDEWLLKKHTTQLRKILSTSEYYKFEKTFLDGYWEVGYSIDQTQLIPYNANFYEFDKKFYTRLNSLISWSIESIIEILYEEFYKIYTKQKFIPKYFATMSHPGHFRKYKNIPKIFPNMKNIVIKRELKSIIATKMNRIDRPTDLVGHMAHRTPLEIILERKEIEEILDFFNTYEELQKKYPNQFFIVDFNELIKNPQNIMKKVATFLDIEYEDILSIPTRDGILLEYNGMSFLGEENDDYRKLLTEEEIQIIDNVEKKYYDQMDIETKDFSANLKLSKTVANIYEQINKIKNNYEKIAIYGFGTFGKLVNSLFAEKVSIIVDKNIIDKNVFHPRNINNESFDVIFISVLGRENQIIDELINKFNIPKNKIICLES